MSTIRHDRTGRTIAAYLATRDGVCQHARILAYMELMHDAPRNTTSTMIHHLTARGVIEKVRPGWYRYAGAA